MGNVIEFKQRGNSPRRKVVVINRHSGPRVARQFFYHWRTVRQIAKTEHLAESTVQDLIRRYGRVEDNGYRAA